MSRSSVQHGEDAPPRPGGTGLASSLPAHRPVSGSGSSTGRGQFESIAALVAVAAVCTALSLYAGVLTDAVPSSDRDVAEPTLRAATDRLQDGGVLAPTRLTADRLPEPSGYRVNVSVTVRTWGTDGRSSDWRWTAGPAPPTPVRHDAVTGDSDRFDVASRRSGVRVAPARVRPGTVRVVVWQ
jgi:hypothetical protein